MTRDLMFVSAGDQHRLHRSLWGERPFDVAIAFYGSDPEVRQHLATMADVFWEAKGGKFQNLWRYWREHLDFLTPYDSVFVADDDVDLNVTQIARLFSVRRQHELWIASPAMSPAGNSAIRVMWHRPRARLHYTSFVEMTAPLFERARLEEFLAQFDGSISGWGTDFWYMNAFGEWEPHRYAVCDEVVFRNPYRRRQTGLREIETLKPEAERKAEWQAAAARHGLREVSRVITSEIPRSRGAAAWARLRHTMSGAGDTIRSTDDPRPLARRLRSHIGRTRVRHELRLVWAIFGSRAQALGGPPERDHLRNVARAWGNTGFAATAGFIEHACDLAKRTAGTVVECGSGLSTILLASALHGSQRPLISLEHDPEWARRVKRALRLLGYDVTVHCAPLTSFGDSDWYDVDAAMVPKPLGLLVIDGPPGSTRGGRLGVLKGLDRWLRPGVVALVDDVDRPADRALVDGLAERLGGSVEIVRPSDAPGRAFAVVGQVPGSSGGRSIR